MWTLIILRSNSEKKTSVKAYSLKYTVHIDWLNGYWQCDIAMMYCGVNSLD